MPLILMLLLFGPDSPSPLPTRAPSNAEALGPTRPRLDPEVRPERRALLRTGVRVVAGGEMADREVRQNPPSLP